MKGKVSFNRIFHELIAVLLLTNAAASVLPAQTKGRTAAAPSAVRAGWSGVITYRKTLDDTFTSDEKIPGRVNDSERIKHLYTRKYNYAATLVVNDLAGTGRAATSTKIEFRDSDFHKVTQNELTNCHSWEPDRMITAESTDRKLTTGTGGGEAVSYSLSVNDGNFRLGFTFPGFQGKYTHSTSETYQNLCPNSTRAPSASSTDSEARVEGAGASVEGVVDFKNPDVIEGSKTWFDTVGDKKSFVYVVTWKLRRKPQPLMITDIRFYEPRYPSPNDWREIDSNGRTVDGNQVRIVATIANFGGTDKTATVSFKELRENAPLSDGAVTATVPSGGQKDVEMIWDTSGYAWRQSGADVVSETARQIEARIPDDVLTKDLTVVPKPVMLVPGFWQNAEAVSKFPLFFRAVTDKWQIYYTPTDVKKISTDNAEKLDREIREIQKYQNAWHVDLIAVTNGGLVARVYVNSQMPTLFDGRPTATHLVMVGVPNAGTPCAVGVYGLSFKLNTFNLDAVGELSPDSMKRFNMMVTNTNGTRFAALVANIRPATCQDDDAPGDGLTPVKSGIWRIKNYFVSKKPVSSRFLLGEESHFRQIYKWLAVPPKGDHAPDPATLGAVFSDSNPAAPNDSLAANFGRTRRYGAMFQPVNLAAVDAGQTTDDAKANFSAVVGLKAKGAAEIEIPVTSGTRFSLVFYGSPEVSATLVDDKGEVVGTDPAGGAGADEIFRTITVKKPFSAGKWKLRLESRDPSETEVAVAAFIDYSSSLFGGPPVF
ncbi:MAG: hypothetical protein JSS81_22895 [Acidobacteria bacterium]|nr:hypothetical protein [Acidobacteriota bacterium]